MRWLAGAVLVVILLVACWVEASASRCPDGNLLDFVAPVSQGLYSPEYSTTLPGPNGALTRLYRWTQPSSQISIWPSLVGAGSLSLQYLDPQVQGKVHVQRWFDRGDGVAGGGVHAHAACSASGRRYSVARSASN